MRKVILWVIGGVVVLVLAMVLCTYVRRPYEETLLVRFGTLIDQKDQARICYNWYFKWPTDSVVRIDKRLHLYTSPLQELTTAKKEPISIRTFAAWRIVDAQVFYRKTGGSDEKAQSTMEAALLALVPRKISTHQLDELFNSDESKIHTDTLEQEVAKEVTEGYSWEDGKRATGLQDLGIQVVEVGFSRMAFPPANAAKVYERMVAELNKQAIQYQAEGLAEANTIRANGLREASDLRAAALAKAQQIRGEGDAAALATLAKVQQDDQKREFYQYWKSLDFLKTSLAKNTILVLSSNSDILKALFQSPKLGQLGTTATEKPPGEAMGITPAATQPGK